MLKLAGVLFTFGGVILVSMMDESSGGQHTIIGDILALVSAFTYAIYVLLFKKLVVHEERIHNAMFLGFMGAFNVVMLWPIGIILNFAHLEKFELPSLHILLFLLLNGLLGSALSDFLWLQSVLLITPVVATVGLSLVSNCNWFDVETRLNFG